MLVMTHDSRAQQSIPQSDNPVSHVEYCLDASASMTFDNVKGCRFVDRDDLTRIIHLGAVIWVRITLDVDLRAKGLPILIHVAPHLIQRIEIFDAQSGRLIAPVAGAQLPFNPEVNSVGGYTFSIPADRVSSRTLYMRIATAGLPFVMVHVDQATDIGVEGVNQQIGLGIHLGALGLMFFLSIGVYGAGKNRVVGCFALLLLNLIFATLSGSGLLMKYVWGNYPALNELFFNSMFYLRLAFWVLLGQAFLSHYDAPRWYRKSCQSVYALVALMLCISWLGNSAISNAILLFGITLAPIVQVIAIQKTQKIERTHQYTLMGGFIIGGLLIWGTLLITIFPLGDPVLSIYLARLVDYVNPVVLLLLVFSDHKQIAFQHANTKKENDEIRLRLEFEQKIKNERKVLIDMLTHELKNPLASISLAIGSLGGSFTSSDVQQRRRLQNISHSIQNMDAVIERCNLMNQLDQNDFSLDFTAIEINLVIDQICQRLDVNQLLRISSIGHDTFVTDPYFFKIIVSNLIENALKYSKAHSDVDINIQLTKKGAERFLVLSVTNEIGLQGYPDPDQVFKRFYRHLLASDTTGSGIGLYLVQELTALLKGQIRYSYCADTGRVSFILELSEFKDQYA